MKKGYSRIERVSVTHSQSRSLDCELDRKEVMPLFLAFCQQQLGMSLQESEEQYLEAIRNGLIDEVKFFAARQKMLR